jgi:hypothetical protein
MIRCHTFQDRPAHCDQLHLDLWWKGLNVLTDAGTYHYYVPGRPDIEHYFKGVRSHNTVEIDNSGPLELVSRFMWLPWPRARLLRLDADRVMPVFEGESLDYDRKPWNILHRRVVLALAPNAWLIIDDLLGTGTHTGLIRWHMQDYRARFVTPMTVMHETPVGPMSLAFACEQVRRVGPPCAMPNSETGPSQPHVFSASTTLVRARDGKDCVQGWISPYYGERLPATTLEVSVRGVFPFRIASLITLGISGEIAVADGANACTVRAGDATWSLQLGRPDRGSSAVIEKCTRAASGRSAIADSASRTRHPDASAIRTVTA